jgi:hypothetical protein
MVHAEWIDASSDAPRVVAGNAVRAFAASFCCDAPISATGVAAFVFPTLRGSMRFTTQLLLNGSLPFAMLLPVASVAAQSKNDAQSAGIASVRPESPPRAHVAAPATGTAVARKAAFGFSYVSYYIDQDDGVFTDNTEHTTQNFGFRVNRAFRRQHQLGWMMDGELFLGVLNRELIDVPLPETIFGLQAFVGPQLRLGRISVNVAAGVNRLSIPGSELVTSSRASVIQWVGRGGLSRLWAAELNALAANNQPTVLASIPAYTQVSPAGLFGLAYDFGGKGFGFRLSAEYTPVFTARTKNNLRLTFSIAG